MSKNLGDYSTPETINVTLPDAAEHTETPASPIMISAISIIFGAEDDGTLEYIQIDDQDVVTKPLQASIHGTIFRFTAQELIGEEYIYANTEIAAKLSNHDAADVEVVVHGVSQ